MKDFSRYSFYAILGMLLLVSSAWQPANAQTRKTCAYRTVNVQIFPLAESNAALERAIRSNTQSFLNMLNRGNPAAFDGIDVRSSDAQDLANACTLHPRYKILVIPLLSGDNQRVYEVRGIHLTNINRPAAQLSIMYNSAGEATSMRIIDESERNDAWAALSAEAASDPNRAEILRTIQELEEAYNVDARSVIAEGVTTMPNVARLLERATVNVSKLKNNRVERIPYSSSARYVQRLVQKIKGQGSAPEITYELVEIYPHVDENGNPSSSDFRVTLIQHWMYPPTGYLDTDYLALDFNLDQSNPISSRNAGRGSFNVYSRPSGIQITRFDSQDWSMFNRVTPYEALINVPWQYHYLTLENVWYAPKHEVVTPDQVVNREDVMVEMEHLPGQIIVNVLPEPRNSTILINGENETDAVNGRVLLINPGDLGGVPSPDAAVTSNERTVQIQVAHPDFNPPVFYDSIVTLPSPDAVTIDVPLPDGELDVSSTPEPSSVLVNGQVVGDAHYVDTYPVTPLNDPLRVQVRNDTCLPGDQESDCIVHVPSEEREVHIGPNQTSAETFYLMPFVVRNDTQAGRITAQPIERNGNLVTVRYQIEDNRDRNRKFFVDFDMMNGVNGGKITDLDGEVTCSGSAASQDQCLGRGIRPGMYEYTWDVSQWEGDRGNVPVLALRKKSTCWPCVLLPAAAGVAAAYIWPRTGSNEDPSFVPPPRPNETQNR